MLVRGRGRVLPGDVLGQAAVLEDGQWEVLCCEPALARLRWAGLVMVMLVSSSAHSRSVANGGLLEVVGFAVVPCLVVGARHWLGPALVAQGCFEVAVHSAW